MTMEKGAVQQLLYQLYTALNRKKKRNLTGTAMETMTAPATKILAQAETQQYQNVCSCFFLLFPLYRNFYLVN
jgi:hypothetical protein